MAARLRTNTRLDHAPNSPAALSTITAFFFLFLMTDHDAIVRAICDHPDDDTPRLIYADFLEENGELDRAGFVRAQVELARTPAWEPFAVLCRHRQRSWSDHGDPFRESLPEFPTGWNLKWHERAFHRGLGWRVMVGSLHAWEEIAPWLFDHAPVGELHLQAPATLDDWWRFAAASWVRRLRAVHLRAGSPVVPVRALCASPLTTGITELAFHVATSPGLPILVSDLLGTRLGVGLRSLSFRLGEHSGLEDLIRGITTDGVGFDRLTMEMMGLTPDLIRLWCDRGGPAQLTELDLANNYAIGNVGARLLAAGLQKSGLHTLGLGGIGMTASGVMAVAGCSGLAGVRRLDLSRNVIPTEAMRALAGSEVLAGVRSLSLRRCQIGDRAVRRLTQSRFWPNLVELDLRENPITGPAVGHLMKAPVPPDLTALLLDATPLSARSRAALREHFGERMILTQPEESI